MNERKKREGEKNFYEKLNVLEGNSLENASIYRYRMRSVCPA